MQHRNLFEFFKIKLSLLLLSTYFLVGCFADVDKIKSCIPKGTLSPTSQIDLYILHPKDGYSHSHINHNDDEKNFLCYYDLVENHFQNRCLENHAQESQKIDINATIELDGYAIKRHGIGADFGFQHTTEFRGKYKDKVVWISSPTLQWLYQTNTDFAKAHQNFFDKLKMYDRVLGDTHGDKYSYETNRKIHDNIWNWDCNFQP